MLIQELQTRILEFVKASGPVTTDQIEIPNVQQDAIYHHCVFLGEKGYLKIRKTEVLDDDLGCVSVLGLTPKGIRELQSRRGSQ